MEEKEMYNRQGCAGLTSVLCKLQNLIYKFIVNNQTPLCQKGHRCCPDTKGEILIYLYYWKSGRLSLFLIPTNIGWDPGGLLVREQHILASARKGGRFLWPTHPPSPAIATSCSQEFPILLARVNVARSACQTYALPFLFPPLYATNAQHYGINHRLQLLF